MRDIGVQHRLAAPRRWTPRVTRAGGVAGMAMTWWDALILGVVQGLTEFFPVSSSGHLVIAGHALGLRLPGVSFEVALHVATLLSVVLVYRRRLLELLLGAGRREQQAYIVKLALATVPAVVAGLLFKDYFEARFEEPVFAATMILVTGCVVWSSRWALGRSGRPLLEAVPVVVAAVIALVAGSVVPFVVVLALQASIHALSRATAPRAPELEPGWGSAVLMGVAQALAILPGITRSGSTVLAGLWRRVDPERAAEFSFLMSIPAILGAAVLSLPELGTEAVQPGGLNFVVGSAGAAVAGILAIRFFVGMLRRRSFHLFSYYCWIAAGLYLLAG
jgi:undecaprenyl-diphosphatase